MPVVNNTRFELAKEIAVEAGKLAVQMRKDRSVGFAERKSHQDFVTAADIAVEELIRQRIRSEFPEDTILGEEKGLAGSGDSVWIVDPIDGTTNFLHGLPDWAVSIGYCSGGKIECAAIFAPDVAIIGSACKGQGAFLNSWHTGVSDCEIAADALVLLGRSARHGAEDYVNQIQRLINCGMEYRRNGSAAYSLLTVAAGRAEAFFEAHLNPWDAIAGILLVEEAGGKVDFPAYPEFIELGGAVLASNSRLHDLTKAAIYGRDE